MRRIRVPSATSYFDRVANEVATSDAGISVIAETVGGSIACGACAILTNQIVPRQIAESAILMKTWMPRDEIEEVIPYARAINSAPIVTSTPPVASDQLIFSFNNRTENKMINGRLKRSNAANLEALVCCKPRK